MKNVYYPSFDYPYNKEYVMKTYYYREVGYDVTTEYVPTDDGADVTVKYRFTPYNRRVDKNGKEV